MTIIPKETPTESDQKPAKQHKILSDRMKQERKPELQSTGFGNAETGKIPSRNTQPALQPNKKQALKSKPPIHDNVGTPESPALKGDWSINLISLSSQSSVKKLQTDFHGKGVVTEVKEVTIKGKQWYRLQVAGFSSKQEATAYVIQVEEKLGLNKVWIFHE